MGAVEGMFDVIKALVPPATENRRALERWRWWVFIALIVVFVESSLHILLACGYIPSLYPGFASKADTRALTRRVDFVADILIQNEVARKVGELCAIPPESKRLSDLALRAELMADIARLEQYYTPLDNHQFKVPTCAAVYQESVL